jgi:site-specific recombinase XerD
MGAEKVHAILGHENIATTMIYAKVSKNNVKLNHTKCIV